jgi:hypothetical protein
MKLLQILFLFLFAYAVYYLVKLFIMAGRNARDRRDQRQNIRDRKARQARGGKTIELDKDQYKVE